MRQPIPFNQSSQIKGLEYDADEQTLYVQYKNGSVYTYHGVDADKANGFASADSAGKYLNAYVKGQHEYKQIG